jgi:hypothetical protein
MMLGLYWLIVFLIGAFTTFSVLKNIKGLNFHLLLNLSLPVSIGLSSVIFVFFNIIGLSIYVILLLEIIILIFLMKKQYASVPLLVKDKKFNFQFFKHEIIVLVLIAFYIYSWLMNAGIFYFDSIKEPHGLWDAWSYWNMKAKFICRAPDNWTEIIGQLNSQDFHGDYPLMQSAFIASSWLFCGNESVWIPIASAFIFTFCTLGLLTGAVSYFSTLKRGLIAGIVLLSTPFFFTLGDSQYADITVGFFYLASIVFITFADNTRDAKSMNVFFISAGVMASLAAWSKNEGLLFICCMIISRCVLKIKKPLELWQEMKWFLLGLLPVVLLLLHYKVFIAAPNDILEAQNSGVFNKLTDIERYKLIGSWFMQRAMNFGEWIFNPVFLFIPLFIIKGFDNSKKTLYGFLFLFLMLGGFFFSYVVSYIELVFHLSTSVHRLFFQLFPCFIFLSLLSLKKGE